MGAFGSLSGTRGLQDCVFVAAGVSIFRFGGVVGDHLGQSWSQGGTQNQSFEHRSRTKAQRKSEREFTNKSKIGTENETQNSSEPASFERPKTIKSVKLSSNSLFFNVRRKAKKCKEKGIEMEPE